MISLRPGKRKGHHGWAMANHAGSREGGSLKESENELQKLILFQLKGLSNSIVYAPAGVNCKKLDSQVIMELNTLHR